MSKAECTEQPQVGLTASLISQFFLREFCGKWDALLTKISVRVSRFSRVSLEGKNAIYCEAWESRNLRDLQTSKIIIHSKKLVLDPKFSQDSLKTPDLKLVMILASLATKFLFARLASLATKLVCEPRSESCYKNSFCKTCKKRFLLWNFVARLARSESCYEISVCETLLILTHESCENLARILGLKSESRFSQEFQKVILVSTPTTRRTNRRSPSCSTRVMVSEKQTDVFSVWPCYYFYNMLSAGWCFCVFKAEFKDTTKVVLLTDKRMG
jgi:ferredoxin-thioredoxin reductase catalytic subunit